MLATFTASSACIKSMAGLRWPRMRAELLLRHWGTTLPVFCRIMGIAPIHCVVPNRADLIVC